MSGEGLRIGDEAPDFVLRDQFGQDVRLSDFRGRKAVALMFYPFAFTGVCTGELSGVRDRLDEFLSFDTEVLALSCDPVYSLRSFAEAEGLNFPLLSDFWPHGAVAQAYEVFDPVKGAPRRSSYVVDREGRPVLGWTPPPPSMTPEAGAGAGAAVDADADAGVAGDAAAEAEAEAEAEAATG